VHSPAEYARIVEQQPAQAFPFIAQTEQLWSSYRTVTEEQIRDRYPLNPGYHVMILVIATSTTVEYTLRGVYENTVGRASWLLDGGRLTDEDRYGANAAQVYVHFIRQEPWYLFDCWSRLKHLWTDVPLFGPGVVRKWEGRYALTTEYAIKAVYGKLIEKAARATYTPARMTTDVVVDRLPGMDAARARERAGAPAGWARDAVAASLFRLSYRGHRVSAARRENRGRRGQRSVGADSRRGMGGQRNEAAGCVLARTVRAAAHAARANATYCAGDAGRQTVHVSRAGSRDGTDGRARVRLLIVGHSDNGASIVSSDRKRGKSSGTASAQE
jgi:hypothetical protein